MAPLESWSREILAGISRANNPYTFDVFISLPGFAFMLML